MLDPFPCHTAVFRSCETLSSLFSNQQLTIEKESIEIGQSATFDLMQRKVPVLSHHKFNFFAVKYISFQILFCLKMQSSYSMESFQVLSIFRFVLYQLSKNLNRPFFMDFLTQLSIRYTEKSPVLEEEDPEDAGSHNNSSPLCAVCNLI